MPTPFLSSEEYDERAHQLYNEGQYEEALTVLREGLALYPNAVELHVGVGYARLAREEYAWARRAFEEALVLEPEHEDGLAGLGETLLKFGQPEAALRCFHRTLELGYADDIDLMLQVGRALQLDGDHTEGRIYLANILYDRGEFEAALYHFERTSPDDHWDELGLWRLIELKRSTYKLDDDDPELRPWDERLTELSGSVDEVDELLMELEPARHDSALEREAEVARGQLELFGTLLNGLVDQKRVEPEVQQERDRAPSEHSIMMRDGKQYAGSWDDIVRR